GMIVNMMYLLGGGLGFKNGLGEEFNSVLQNKNSITFIPTSPQDKNKCEKYKKVNLSWFHDIGIEFDKVTMINQEDDVTLAQDKIGIDLTNGINVDVHYTNEHDENLYQIIKEYEIDKIYAIPEDGALRIDNEGMKFIGEDKFYIIKQGLKEQVR
ncbi:hypothetical protein, partial [Vallitalea sediminicola]